METAAVKLGKFQTRCGRAARIDSIGADGTGAGVLCGITSGSKDEFGHMWRADGSYSKGNIGMFHHFDLMEKVTD